MTDHNRLAEQIKMEADEVLFDGMHFDIRLKDRVRQAIQQAPPSPKELPRSRRGPWLQLSLVAAVFAVAVIGSNMTLPGTNLAQFTTQSAAPSSAPPSQVVTDMVESEAANKLSHNSMIAPISPATDAGLQEPITTTGKATEPNTSLMMTSEGGESRTEMREYQLEAELPVAPVVLKTAAEALLELQQREHAPDEPQGKVIITQVELVQWPTATYQTEKGELCYLFSGHYESGALFSHYVYAEKGKVGIPQ